jgi:fatty acid desaturase
MSTITLKRSFWKDFEKTRTWKYVFFVLDGIMCVVSCLAFFLFVLIFADHSAKTAWGFFTPMLLVLGFILAFTSLVMHNYSTLSWLAIAGIDALITIGLIVCVAHPIWSDEYREKMGYPTRFG